MRAAAPQVRELPGGPSPAELAPRLARGWECVFWLDSATATPEAPGPAPTGPAGAPSRWSVFGVAEGFEDAPEPAVGTPAVDTPVTEPAAERAADPAVERAAAPPRAEAAGSPAADTPVTDPAWLWGGWIGYFAYEASARFGHPVPPGPAAGPSPTPDSAWIRVHRHLLHDHRTRRTWAVGDASWVAEAARAASCREGENAPNSALIPPLTLPAPDPERYRANVRAALAEIRDGNSYEVCLTAETQATLNLPLTCENALNIYLAQRAANPAPHAAFLWMGDHAVLSSSPERFLRVGADGVAEAKPIKGTVPRGRTPELDAAAAAWLAADPKTRAENLMIVDLMRNDLARVCVPGSVTVPVLMGVESYASVHQLVSTVRGRLPEGAGALDLVAACFPGGSMTGAPKPSTLRIIAELERRPRGVYSGALGYLAPDGAADLSIVIRTLVLTPGSEGGTTTVRAAAGGAIVADSDPEAELQEMLAKLRAPLPQSWTIP